MELITIDMFLTLAGCVTVVGLLTEASKHIPLIEKVSPMIVNFVLSVIVGIIRLFVVGDFSGEGILLNVLNIFVILVATSGTYEVAKNSVNGICRKVNKIKKGAR